MTSFFKRSGKEQTNDNFYKNDDTFETKQGMFRSFNDHLQLKVD